MTFLPHLKFLQSISSWQRKLFIFSLVLISSFFIAPVVFAQQADFLSSCIIAGAKEGGDSSTNGSENGQMQSSITFTDIEKYNYCKTKCTSAFSLIPKDADTNNQNNDEMNQSGIDACIESCLTTQNNFVANNLAYDQQPMKDPAGNPTDTMLYVTGYQNTTSSVSAYTKKPSACVNSDGAICADDPSVSVLIAGVKRDEKTREANFSIELDTSKKSPNKNTIYRCGQKTVTLTPTYPNVFGMNPEVTEGGNSSIVIASSDQNEKNYFSYVLQPNYIKERLSNTRSSSPPFVWCPNSDEKQCNSVSDFKSNPRMMHSCFANIPATTWSGMSTKDFLISCKLDGKCGLEQFWQKLTNNSSTGQSPNSFQAYVNSSQSTPALVAARNMEPNCYTNWHVYNSRYADTGINIANGDEITISWGGNIIADANKIMNPNPDLPSGIYPTIQAAVDAMWPNVEQYGTLKNTLVTDINRARDAIISTKTGGINVNAPFAPKDVLQILKYGVENGGPGISGVYQYCKNIGGQEYANFYNEADQYRKMAKWGTVESWIERWGGRSLSTHCPDPSKLLASEAAIGYVANMIAAFDKSSDNQDPSKSSTNTNPVFVDYKTAKLATIYGLSGSPSADKDNVATQMDKFIADNRGMIDYAKVLREISTIQVENLQPLVGEYNGRFAINNNPDTSDPNNTQICKNVSAKNNLPDWYGLKGQISSVTEFFDQAKNPNLDPEKVTQPLSCRAIQNPSLAKYTYQGILSGLSSRIPLAIKHNVNSDRNGADLLGGHQVVIVWKGSPIKNGDGVQIAIVKDALDKIPDTAWVSLSDILTSGKKYTYDIKARIPEAENGVQYNVYARIDPNKLKNAGCLEEVPPTSGTYDLKITSVGVKSSITRSIVEMVQDVLFGKNMCSTRSNIAQGGVVRSVYEAVIEPTKTYAIVLTLLFLVFSGFAFMTGIAKMNQQEFVNRTLKMAFVIAMLGIGSWELFGKNMVQMFVCGALDLATIASPVMVFDPSGKMSIQSAGSALDIFDSISGPLNVFLSPFTLKRIWALMTTGIIGFVMAIGLIFAAVQVWMVMIPLLFTYIYSIIGVAVLIIMIPVISPLILFSVTKRYFDVAVKYLIVYGLFPMVIFATYSLLNLLIITLVNIITFFSICPICILKVFGSCVIPGYQIITPIFMPPQAEMSTFSAPIGGLAAILGLLALTSCAKGLIQLGTKILNRVIGVQAFGGQSAADPADLVNLGEMTGGLMQKAAMPYAQKAISTVGGGVKGLFGKGIDAEEQKYQKEVDKKIDAALRDSGYSDRNQNPNPDPVRNDQAQANQGGEANRDRGDRQDGANPRANQDQEANNGRNNANLRDE